jgi:LysR family transcriptional regulator, low CO2-responsive transcriptional regulator
VQVDVEIQGTEGVKAAVMAGMGVSFVSAHTVQTELATGRIAMLAVEGMPKFLDWCLMTRRDTPLSAGQQLFRAYTLERGAEFAACAMTAGPAGPAAGVVTR